MGPTTPHRRPSATALALAALGVLSTIAALTGCGDGSDTAADGDPDDASAPTDTTAPDDSDDPTSTGSDGSEVPTDTEVVEFEVGGVRAWTWSALDDVPERAGTVRTGALLLDEGDGFMLCDGPILDSLPPQCSGPIVDGLDTSGWTIADADIPVAPDDEEPETGAIDAERSGDVVWATRTVTVTWPPVDGHITLVRDEALLEVPPPISWDEQGAGRNGLPPECEERDDLMGGEPLQAFADANPDRTDLARVVYENQEELTGHTTYILGVVEGQLDDVRAELESEGAGTPCLETVTYSRNQLMTTQRALDLTGYSPDGPMLSTASGNAANRVVVDVTVADRATVRTLADAVDDPGQVLVIGQAVILEAS